MRPITLLKPAFSFLLPALFALGSCNQDAIFHEISQANKPLEARIKGSPTNMVAFTRNGRRALWVASGSSLHWYTGSGWDKDSLSGSGLKGDIRSLAATDNYLYALTASGLYRIGQTGDWSLIKKDSSFEIVCADRGDTVFVGSRSGSTYHIVCLDEQTPPATLCTVTDTGELTGAAFNGSDRYYLSTKERIYEVDTGAAPVTATSRDAGHYMGIVSLQNGTPSDMVAMERNGQLHLIDGSSGAVSNASKMSQYATSALAIWRNSASPSGPGGLILAGRQDTLDSSGYTYGYQELPLDANGRPAGSFKAPGNAPTSMNHGGNYDSSIGTHHVNHLFQAPNTIDGNMTLFASTQGYGLWSYRNRSSGGWQWNAED